MSLLGANRASPGRSFLCANAAVGLVPGARLRPFSASMTEEKELTEGAFRCCEGQLWSEECDPFLPELM